MRQRLTPDTRRLASALLVLGLGGAIGWLGCGDKTPAPAPTTAAKPPAADVAWIRHILIQYKGAQGAAPAVTRSKASAESLLVSLRARVIDGGDFGALARQYSDDASAPEGGEIAPIKPGETPPQFETAAAALKAGEMSPVFETPLGFHLIQRLGMTQIAVEHILIRYHGATEAPDSLLRSRAEAQTLAEKILAEVRNPQTSFPMAAAKYSDDEATAPKGGFLGPFTRGRLNPAFEAAAFALEMDQVSGIVETPFGFHIIKRVTPDLIRLEHILISHAGSDGLERNMSRGREEALQRALDVLFRIRKGEDFEALAREFSDDKLTAPKGGKLALIGRGQTVPEFEEAAFALQPGQVSDVVETKFGFHIIKRLY